MPETIEICRSRALSEEYRDFIFESKRPYFLNGISGAELCEQYVGYEYHVVYIDKMFADPMSLDRFTYGVIPKCYTLLDTEALNEAGISQIQNYPTLKLTGKGVMIGFIDTGIDYQNPIFQNLDGTTRIAGIWDQTIQEGAPPQGFVYGTEYTEEKINEALQRENPLEVVPSKDENSHGTFLASIAAGSENIENRFKGAAPEATLGIVKLKKAKQYLKDFYLIGDDAECYQENDIMLGIRYLTDLAKKKKIPLVLCIALGTNMGDHNGTSPLCNLLEIYSYTANMGIVIGGGNEANQRHHYYGLIENMADSKNVEIRVAEGVKGFSLELWTEIPNVFAVSIVSPAGEKIPLVPVRQGIGTVLNFVFERTSVYLDYRLLVERTNSELILMRFADPSPGIWRIVVEPQQLADGIFHMWLPVTEFLTGDVYFLQSNPDTTITEPGNTPDPMTVASYNGADKSIAIDSGRGYTRGGRLKPEFAAPGVDVMGAVSRGQFTKRTGSSIATGITAGATALLFEWIVYQLGRTNIDSIQLKNLMILGTERKDTEVYPNRSWGYGSLNLYNTFEQLRTF